MTGIAYPTGSPNVRSLAWSSSVTQYGITWNFAAPRPVGQYVNGDWFVIGPVTIVSTSPASQTISGVYYTGAAYTGRKINGMMINPGNRSYAPGGLKENNATNSLFQGFDSLPPINGTYSGSVATPYDTALNVDPGSTGVPLNVTTGSLVKVISTPTPPSSNYAIVSDMAILTVVNEVPPADAFRPGVAWTSKAHPFRMRHVDFSVFQNLAPTTNAPSAAAAAALVVRAVAVDQPDNTSSRNIMATNNSPEYGRDIAGPINDAALALHLNFTLAEKKAIFAGLAQVGIDVWARAFEGAITLGAGGGNGYKKVPLVMAVKALGAKATATSMDNYADYTQYNIWSEDQQIFRVRAQDVITPRYTADGRPRTAYSRYMIGSAEWGENASNQPERSGSNWDTFYRSNAFGKLLGGILAVQLMSGAQAIWNYPDFFVYADNTWKRKGEFQVGPNSPSLFQLDMMAAYRVLPVGPIVVRSAEVKDAVLYFTMSHALDDGLPVPATSDFVVNVNGSPVAKTGVVQLWRQNVGLTLAAPVTGNDVVTFSYTPGTNKIKTVDSTDVPAISARAVTNRSDKVGGPNAAYPVVRFSADTRYTIVSPATLADANNALGTFALLKLKFISLPASGQLEILGNQSAQPPFRIFISSTGSIEIRFTDFAGQYVFRGSTTTQLLVPGTAYDILVSVDATQTTAAAGASVYINGVAATINSTTWTGGAGKAFGWNRGGGTTFNFSGAVFELGAFWFDATSRLDLSVSGNRAKFSSMTGGNLDILTLGNGITGSQPSQFVVGNAAQWNSQELINRGTGRKFKYLSGTPVTDVGAPVEWI